MRPEGNSDPDLQCPVDHQTREKWLEAARAKNRQQPTPSPPASTPSRTTLPPPPRSTPHPTQPALRFSLDALSWQPTHTSPAAPRRSRNQPPTLSTDREISTIPRATSPNTTNKPPNPAELAATPPPPPPPANAQSETGADPTTGNWIYPSQAMFFSAMQRKGHKPSARDMPSIIPIHNAVNERAWSEIKQWEAGRGSAACGGPRLVSFAGDSKALTPKARMLGWLGYEAPFDRHDWVVDRCGREVDYVIDFYGGKGGMGKGGLSFYLDVRPKVNCWEGVKMRMERAVFGFAEA